MVDLVTIRVAALTPDEWLERCGARSDFGPWRSLYEHDYREAGESPASLAGRWGA